MSYYQFVSKHFPSSFEDKSDAISFFALAGSVSLVLISIAASQILLGVAIASFAWRLRKSKGVFPWGWRVLPLLPLVIFMVWTIIAALASSDVSQSLRICKKFYLFLLVPMVPFIVQGQDRLRWVYKAVFGVALLSSLTGLAQFIADPGRDLMHRISGFMSQWMTYSGLLMLALILLASYLLYAGVRRHLWVIPVTALVVLALILTLTRNSWMGAIAGIVVLFLLWRPKAVFVLLVAVMLLYLISPDVVKQRVRSIVDLSDPRFHVYMTALHIIHDHPWVGVGPKLVKVEAPKYRDLGDFPEGVQRIVGMFSDSAKYQEEEKEYPAWLYQHMHNNLLQIAAESGIPGLILWLWLMGRLARDAYRGHKNAVNRLYSESGDSRKDANMASAAALASWAALMVAGLFEYNFGDSEVLILFLFIVSAPYAFRMPKQAPSLP